MQGHRDLVVWQKSMALVTDVYQATPGFPQDEVYGLRSQIRRAAESVPSNLAEGHGRNSRKEFHQFIGQARGSLLELETQLEVARNPGFLSPGVASDLLSKAGEIARVLNGLRLQSKSGKGARWLLTTNY
ncbi:MAG TPA: four helix bundle protein [Terriglobales bacterium]|nr:four helix bundle protein [Terriglobales bacterium]